jgi:hypothetical protein
LNERIEGRKRFKEVEEMNNLQVKQEVVESFL